MSFFFLIFNRENETNFYSREKVTTTQMVLKMRRDENHWIKWCGGHESNFTFYLYRKILKIDFIEIIINIDININKIK